MQTKTLAAVLVLPVITACDVDIFNTTAYDPSGGAGSVGGDGGEGDPSVDTHSPCDVIAHLTGETGLELYKPARAWEALNDIPPLGEWIMYAAAGDDQFWEWVDGLPITGVGEAALLRGELPKDPVYVGTEMPLLNLLNPEVTSYRYAVTKGDVQTGVSYGVFPAQSVAAGDWTLYYAEIPGDYYSEFGEFTYWSFPKGNVAGMVADGSVHPDSVLGSVLPHANTVPGDGHPLYHGNFRYYPAEGLCKRDGAGVDETG